MRLGGGGVEPAVYLGHRLRDVQASAEQVDAGDLEPHHLAEAQPRVREEADDVALIPGGSRKRIHFVAAEVAWPLADHRGQRDALSGVPRESAVLDSELEDQRE